MTALEKLQLRGSIAGEELCHCVEVHALLLRSAFTEFPVFCAECTGQILPDTLEIPEPLATRIVEWRTVFDSLFNLWLVSGTYEAFACTALLDVDGEVNRLGLDITHELGKQRPAYYWWFLPGDDPAFNNARKLCPVCRKDMRGHATRHFAFCDECKVAV